MQPFAKRFNSFGFGCTASSGRAECGQRGAASAWSGISHLSAFDGTKNAKLTAFDADVGGEPAIELATGCGVRRQRCASDCCSALGSLLRCVEGNDYISGERPGRSRATDLIKSRSASCALGHREKTPANAILRSAERGAAATGASVAADAATHYPERPSRASI